MNESLLLMKKALEKKNMVVVYRDGLGASDCAGIPVAYCPELAVLQNDDDFRLDGYTALRPGDVTLVEQFDESAFCRRALEGEGVYAAVRALPFPAEDWKALIDGVIRTFGGWMAVGCEMSEEPSWDVGRAVSAQGGFLTLEAVDADGTRHPQTQKLPLDEITTISFGDNYLRVFAKYLK